MKLQMRMQMDAVLTVFLLILLTYRRADGSHFRGGLITWRPVNKTYSSTDNIQVEFGLRFGWRRTYGGATHCDKSDIALKKLIGDQGSLECFQGCQHGSIGSTQVHCTDFSERDDWSIGERLLVGSFTSRNGPFYIGYSGYAWIDHLRVGGGNWRIRTFLNLTIRSDIGMINSSPLTTTAPIMSLQQGCNHTIKIPVIDEDGDDIRCRWGESSQEECGGICRAFLGATLDERSCTIYFPSSGQIGWYAVAVMIEDFSSKLSTQPLSGVPLQFLVNVYTSSTKCATINPKFVDITRVEGSCVGVPPNSTFFEPIIAYSGGDTFSITEIQTVSPLGFTKSDLAQWKGDSNTWYVNMSYTSEKKDSGPKLFCYTAFSSSGSTSSQTCITLLDRVSPPGIVEGSNYPVGSILPNHTNWRISFDLNFVRPARRSFIRFRNSIGIDVLKIDTSTSLDVSFPNGGDTLQFKTSFSFREKETYSILMDPGVVKGILYCGAESKAVRDPNYWRIRIKDITPPKLTFTSAPAITLGNIKITWAFDEDVAEQRCTLQTPESTFIVQACNNSWSLKNLTEGLHNLSIEAIDLEGNTSPSTRHTWRVDLTPPTILITHKPQPVSNMQVFTFAFQCNEQCSLECAVTNQTVLPQKYLACNSATFKTGSLDNDGKYTLYVVATDIVGNRAQAKTYFWEIDRTLPVIGLLANQSVACGSSYDPSVTGHPTRSDNRDPSPKLTYKDEADSGCSVKRKWTLVDEVGNKAEMIQFIIFTSKRSLEIAFEPNYVVPCGSTSEITGDGDVFNKAIKVVRPCNRTVKITFQDSDVVNRCGFTFTRTWTVLDNCSGEKALAIQTIEILPLQVPESPQNNEVNVDLNKVLRWPQYPGAFSYQIYIWYNGWSKPNTPSSIESYRRYIPDKPYQPGSRILWQIQYVIGAGKQIPSPVWGFKTISFPDLAVIAVTVPAYAFSGTTFDISWRVQNIGNISTGGAVWYDDVHISRFPSRNQASLAGRKLQRIFLDPGDWYSSKTTISLKANDFGNRYVFIETNVYHHVTEIDRSNNIGASVGPMSIKLTPPPDLHVLEIVTPDSTFSGVTISIQWKVKNIGVGATRGDIWYDTAFWCTSTSLSDCNVQLAVVQRTNGLLPGAQYNVTASVFVPHAIYGNYFILVQTDSRNNIYEHTNEDNNVVPVKSSIKVSLTPPPDLVVEDIQMLSKPPFCTFDVIEIKYTVVNMGSTAPFEPYWSDEMVIISEKKRKEFVMGIFAVSTELKPGKSYSRTVTFTIPASFEEGTYRITARADYRGRVFEYTAENNNARSMEVIISRKLPDLVVRGLTYSIQENSEQSRLLVNWTISNVGAASTLRFQWTDRLYLQTIVGDTYFTLGERAVHLSIKPRENYTITDQIFSLSNRIFGKMKLILFADAIGQLDEENDKNNAFTLNIDIPMFVPDLLPTSLRIVKNGEIFPNSLITLQWRIQNIGRGKVTGKWEDSIYSNSPRLDFNQVRLDKVERQVAINPGQSYNFSAEVKIPENVYPGENVIEVHVNNPASVYEAGQTRNNIIKVNFAVQYPPATDLVPTSLTYDSIRIGNTARYIFVFWSVQNIGNSMQTKGTWKDKVVMIAKDVNQENSEKQYELGTFTISAILTTNREYSMYKIIPIPPNVQGNIRIQVICDTDNSISEIGGEGNNVKQGSKEIDVGVPRRAKFLQLWFGDLPKQVTYFSSIRVIFNVQNVGNRVTLTSSWTDALFLHKYSMDTTANILTSGKRLSTINHNGALDIGERYYVNITVGIPVISPKEYYVHIIVDLNNVLGLGKNISWSNHSLLVSIGPLPDLTVGCVERDNKVKQGGSPDVVRFNVTNGGMSQTRSAWYDAIYLSEDATIDPFDWRLGIVVRPVDLQPNETYTQTMNVFLPFDLPSKEYYLIFNTDSTNNVLETSDENNQATQLIRIEEAPRTDIFIRQVEVPSTTTLSSETTLKWNVGNNGSLSVSGYRCDVTFFSKDGKIDFDDYELDAPKCSTFSISPSGSDATNDIKEHKIVRIPLVEQGTYKTIVKTRSNTRDINPENNIGVSVNGTIINVTALPVDGVALETTLKSLEKKMWRLPNVQSEETLVVSLQSDTNTDFNRLYLREGKPPSTLEFDAASDGDFSADKHVVIPTTKALDYYLLVQNDGTLLKNVDISSNIQLTAKYAKFEVISVFPARASPIGETTLRVIGTLFPEYVNVFLLNRQNTSIMLKAIKVYRFSSTEVYATFKFDGLKRETIFDLLLQDFRYLGSNEAIYRPSKGALQLFAGVPGKLSFKVETSEAFSAGENSFVTVHVHNNGDTDVPVKMMLFSIENANARLVSGNFKSEYGSKILFVPVNSAGPGGLLPPKGSASVSFEVKSDQDTSEASLDILTMGISEDKEHVFMMEKELLKPFYYTAKQWQPVWTNLIKLVGKTEKSLIAKLNGVSSSLSVLGRKIYSVNGLITFLVDIADGTFLSGSNTFVADDVDSSESPGQEFSLSLRRKYSFALGLRYSYGVLGRGWILPWWDTSVKRITQLDIFLEWERQQYIFEPVTSEGVYYNSFLGGLYLNETSNSLVLVKSDSNLEYHYNTSSKLLTSIKRTSDNGVITISYNKANDRPERFTTSSGNSMTVKYDNTGKLKSTYLSVDDRLILSNYEYEDQTSLLTAVTVNGKKTVYQYDENEFLILIHFPDNRTIINKYDHDKLLESSRLFTSSGSWVRSLQYKRDGNGQIEVTEQPIGLVSTYKYDDRSRLAFYGRGSLLPFKMRDDGFNRYVSHGDEVISREILASNGRQLSRLNAKGDLMEVFYNDFGKVREYNNGEGAVYKANFNSDGKLSEAIYPDMSTQKYEYDENSKLSQLITRSGHVKKFYFDDSKNVIRKEVGESETTVSYDQDGNMVSASNDVGTIFIAYTSNGLPNHVQYPNKFSLLYTYDLKGRRSSLSYNGTYNISYLYDDTFGKLNKVVENGNKTLMEIKYAHNGRASRRILGNGMYTVYEYDSFAINLLRLTNYHSNGTVSSRFEYSYDTKGRRISMNTTDGVWIYRYDSLSQLITIKDPWGKTVRYTYDSRGNRLTEVENGRRSYYTVNNLDQIVTHGDRSFSYDKNGNLINKYDPSKTTQEFEFDADNRMIRTKLGRESCRYVYGALGNLYEKSCEDGTRTNFIVDPFGLLGGDIVGKIVNGREIIFVHGLDHGLIARLELGKQQALYYQYDPQGSAVSLMDSTELQINSYTYNTFGIVTWKTEMIENDFLFMGQWGVVSSKEVPNVCYMRARFYDAEEGRFMSMDPTLFPGRSRNIYIYVNNNPVTFVDPKGENILPAVIGGLANAGLYIATHSLLADDITLGGLAGSLVGEALGGIGGAGVRAFVTHFGLKGASAVLASLPQLAKVGAVSSVTGEAVKQAINGEGFNKRDFGRALTGGLLSGWVPMPKLCKKELLDLILSGITGSTASSVIGLTIADKFKEAKEGLEDFLKRAKESGKNVWENLMQLPRSFDPNDMIGPSGFGDSRFIRVSEKIIYKIRFENAANATAPAQRVFIKIKLDNDLDLRTFRLGSYGFGDYVAEIKESKSILQEKVKLIEPHDIYLRVQSGLDIAKGEATWTFQSIDAKTVFPPTDPRRGFLPPNNGTTGQGFVIFTIYPKDNLESFTRIDAKAVIYLDKNEPINIPPIFNTIDASYPVVTMSLLNETSQTGTPYVAFHKNDSGSGFRNVDLYVANASGSNDWTLLMEDVSEDIAFIPLKHGTLSEILVVGEDNVGNRDESGTNIQTIYIPSQTYSCIAVNNCSRLGRCTGLNWCQCISGRYGIDCSETSPPVEPPIIEFVPSYNISITKAVPLFVNSRLVLPLTGTSLKIMFSNIKKGFSFNKGHVDEKGTAIFDHTDIGDLMLIPPPYYTGALNLTVTALAVRGERNASRSGVLYMYFHAPQIGTPELETNDLCLNITGNDQKIPLVDLVSIRDNMDAMVYQLHITKFPHDFTVMSTSKENTSQFVSQNETIKIPSTAIHSGKVYIPLVRENFAAVNVSVYLVILPNEEVVKRDYFLITLCSTPTTGVPVKEDVGPVDKVVPGDKSSNTRNLIIGISVAAGILFWVIFIICCARKCCGASGVYMLKKNPPHQGDSSATTGTINMEVLN